jgi:hypothetical protein
MRSERSIVPERSSTQGHDKRFYSTPRLTVHGTVEEITHNVGTGAVDFPDGSVIQG